MKAIILAAGRGSRMGDFTNSYPKCLSVINGKPLIEHQIEALTSAGIQEIAIITGYKSKMLQKYGTYHFHNEKWQETNMVFSLLCARHWLDETDCIVGYSDIYYTFQIVKDLIACADEVAVAYDPKWFELWSKRFENPLDDAETFRIDKEGYIVEIGQKPKSVEEIQGQYMGLLKFNKSVFYRYVEQILCPFPSKISMTAFINRIKDFHKIKAVSNQENWFEFDSQNDINCFGTI